MEEARASMHEGACMLLFRGLDNRHFSATSSVCHLQRSVRGQLLYQSRARAAAVWMSSPVSEDLNENHPSIVA
jgi:hypothetical protein